MECYEGILMIKTYRGHLLNDGQDKINLKTNKGAIGYKIKNFQVMGPDANTNVEHVVKIYKLFQSTVTTDIDFTDGDLLAAAIINDTNDPHYIPQPVVIFDQEIFNQDIYITSKGHDNTTDINYYLELEQIKLNENQSTVATLQSLRQIAER